MADSYRDKTWSPFLERLDHDVVGMWQRGEWADFCDMLPEYASKGHGEGFMHDTAMLLGALGWNHYDRGVEIITPYFGSSGTGQLNAEFPVSPMPIEFTRHRQAEHPRAGRRAPLGSVRATRRRPLHGQSRRRGGHERLLPHCSRRICLAFATRMAKHVFPTGGVRDFRLSCHACMPSPMAVATTASFTCSCAWGADAAHSCIRPPAPHSAVPRARTSRRCWLPGRSDSPFKSMRVAEVFDAKIGNLHEIFNKKVS